jgi:hypothetical protein
MLLLGAAAGQRLPTQGGAHMAQHPPMDPDTDEASAEQLDAARAQGEAYGRALRLMTGKIADDGGERRAGDYLIGYAVERAEGMYRWTGDGVEWTEPGDDNCHVEVSVRDAGDGRFVPDCRVTVTLGAADGTGIGTHEQPMLWHPMLYHYGRNWRVPGDGRYTLRIRVDPPTFMRHDEVNGRRFLEPVEVEFTDVEITTGQD